jgi:putative ABC transport system permease protein
VHLTQWISQGHAPQQAGEALVEKHFAKFRGIHMGDSLDIGGKSFAVVGMLEIREGAQVAASNIYLRLADAQSLLPEAQAPINVVYLRLRDPAMQGAVQQKVLAAFPGLSASSSDSFLELMGGVSVITGKFSVVASLVALVGAILLILKSMLASLGERLPEIGVLKAVGWTGKDVQGQLLGEAMVQCLLGGLIGIGLGYLGAYCIGTLSIPMNTAWELNPVPASAKIGELASQAIRLPIQLSWILVTTALACSIVTGLVATFLLGKIATRMRPADILSKL